MHHCRAVAALSLLAVMAASHTAEARKKRRLVEEHVFSLEHYLLPDAIADRIEGSGIECRSVAIAGGARHRMTIGSLRLNLSDRTALRGGLGIAHIAPLPLAMEHSGAVISAGITMTLWRTDGYSADVDLAGMQARYEGGQITEGSALLMFRRRR
jgi:hypothetical protein